MDTDSPFLYLIPTPLGNLDDFTLRAHKILKSLKFVACEDTRTSAPLLRSINAQLTLFAAHEHNENEAAQKIIHLLNQNESVGLVTDAGTPAISDPGAKIVRAVQQAGFRVVPLPGACAAITAFCASGFVVEHFYFYGFLPTKKGARINALKALKTQNGALIFYESPHRIQSSLADFAAIFPNRELWIARELSKMFEECVRLKCAQAPQWLEADSNRQKGEFVLVLDQAPIENVFEQKADELLQLLLQHQLSLKTVVHIAGKVTGMAKKDLYERALALKS